MSEIKDDASRSRLVELLYLRNELNRGLRALRGNLDSELGILLQLANKIAKLETGSSRAELER